jgi:hypothetical protein
LPGRDFLALLTDVGFSGATLTGFTGFKTSPYTEGALFMAEKPALPRQEDRDMAPPDALAAFQAFADQAFVAGALNKKTKHLIALGASLAGACEL